MKKIIIPLSGISRNTDDTVSTDGDCMELINARIKNGSIIPAGKPIQLRAYGDKYKKGFYHSLAKRYLFIKNDNGSLIAYNDEFQNPQTLSHAVLNVQNIEFIGYTLCALTEAGIQYFIFKNEQYIYIGNKPDFTLNVYACEEKKHDIEEDFIPENDPHNRIDYRDVPSFLDALDSYKNKALEPYSNEGRFADPVCVRAALKTYNGNYISHSPIFVIFPNSSMNKYGEGPNGSLENISGEITMIGQKWAITIKQQISSFRIKYNVDFDDIAVWKDIITSIDIFVSRPFNIIDSEISIQEGIQVATNTIVVKTWSKDSMEKKIMNAAATMYLSESCYANTNEGYLRPADVSRGRLPDDQFSKNSIYGKCSFVYNGRLHLGNIKNILFKGFSRELFLAPQYSPYNGYEIGSLLARLKIYVYINTESGEKIVFNESNVINPLPPLFCYPDYRASKVEIFAMAGLVGGNSAYKKRTLPLTSNGLNTAYFLGWDYEYQRVSPLDMTDGTTITEEEYNNPGIIIDNIEETPNKIKVSDLNDPYTFPATQTYTVSNGDIIGMASATTALSSGQFGQFPLYVFCNDGIYALSTGSGDTVYSTSSPVSRDVCTSKDSITSLDNAIVFASDAGLMLLSGSSTQKLSDKIEGYLPTSLDSSPVLKKILAIPQLKSSISEFRNYIEKACIGYIYEDKEIVVSNKQYPYSYVYNLPSREWHKISIQIDSFLNSYPKSLIISANTAGCGIYNLHNPHRTINNIAILTRPIKFGSLTHKRILQSALRGILRPSLSDVYIKGEPVQFRGENVEIFSNAGFYVLGSNDAEHFSLLSGTENLHDVRDLITKMNKTKAYKYFMFCLVGGVRTDVAINYVEVMADETYANRLR